MDALSGYGLYERMFVDGCGGEMNDCYVGRCYDTAERWSAYMAQNYPGKPIWLPLQFNFNDSYTRPGENPILTSTPEQAGRICSLWKERAEASEKSGGNEKRIFHMTSWNEMLEGTAAAPSRNVYSGEEYRDAYLRIIQSTFN